MEPWVNRPQVRAWHTPRGSMRFQPLTLDECYVRDLGSLRRFWIARDAFDLTEQSPVLYNSAFAARRVAHRRVERLRSMV